MTQVEENKAKWHESKLANLTPRSAEYQFHIKRIAYWRNK